MGAPASRLDRSGAWIPAGSRRLAAATALCALLAGAPTAAAAGQTTVTHEASHTLTVKISLTGTSQRIPTSFLGLSVEVNELLSYVQEGAVLDRALSLLRPASGDPIVLRVGGKSADDAYWETQPLNAPPWVFEIGPDWLGQLATLARRDRLRVSLDVNLAVHSPLMAAG